MKIVILLLVAIACSKPNQQVEIKEVYHYYTKEYLCSDIKYIGYSQYNMINCIDLLTGEKIDEVINVTNMVKKRVKL